MTNKRTIIDFLSSPDIKRFKDNTIKEKENNKENKEKDNNKENKEKDNNNTINNIKDNNNNIIKDNNNINNNTTIKEKDNNTIKDNNNNNTTIKDNINNNNIKEKENNKDGYNNNNKDENNNTTIKDNKENNNNKDNNNNIKDNNNNINNNNKNTTINNNINKNIERYPFLINPLDHNMRSINDLDYDKSKLYIPPSFLSTLTNFEQQFWNIKMHHFDTIVCFKKGKFYELYEHDAVIAEKEFQFKITDRVNMKMAGFPEGKFNHWAGEFLKKGYKVARVDQQENMIQQQIRMRGQKDSKKKIIQRTLKEIITPGTVYNYNMLNNNINTYIASAIQYNNLYCMALLDCCSNKMFILYTHNILHILYYYNIKEIITDIYINNKDIIVIRVNDIIKNIKDKDSMDKSVKYNHKMSDEEYMCYSLIEMYFNTLNRKLCNVEVKRYNEYMLMDNNTVINLDLLGKNGLLDKINYTLTSYGKRKLREYMLSPLYNKDDILNRRILTNYIRNRDIIHIKDIEDIERVIGKLNSPKIEDIQLIINNMKKGYNLLSEIIKYPYNNCKIIEKYNIKIQEIADNIENIIVEFNNKYKIKDGIIDNIEISFGEIEESLEKYRREQENIIKYPIKYKNIGKDIFLLEINKECDVSSRCNNINKYLLHSSTKNTNRYYTDELLALVKEYNYKKEEIFIKREFGVQECAEYIKNRCNIIYRMMDILGEIDCYRSFSEYNNISGSVYSTLGDGCMKVKDMRNPLFSSYVGNDLEMGGVLLLSGPNMGGKSTLLRSVCYNVILNQMGMGVMCESAVMRVFDRIFTRMGASDSLSRGLSTFQLEMEECGRILVGAGSKSLVVMDELGRGTSTKDGMAIAYSVIKYLSRRNITSLFSTHYNNIIIDSIDNNIDSINSNSKGSIDNNKDNNSKGSIDNNKDNNSKGSIDNNSNTIIDNNNTNNTDNNNIKAMYMKSTVDGDSVIFHYKLVDGIADSSLGVKVARLAGVDENIIKRAEDILSTL